MEHPDSIQHLTNRIQKNWLNWQALISQAGRENLTTPGVAGDWSLKDIIAHITWHEEEMLGLVEAHALVGSELWNLPTDERNEAIFQQVRHQPLEQVLKESAQVHQQLLDALPTLSDEDLTDPSGFPDMPPDWQPGDIIAQNTYEHYQDHLQDLQRWLAEGDSSLRSE